jgi:disulfide bond formation protein DsbB
MWRMMLHRPPQALAIGRTAREQRPGVLGCLIAMFSQRTFRVLILVLAIAAMSAVDLYLTLLYVTHTGMNEMNPLARAMMDYQSPTVLALWKAATVGLSIGILMMIRKQRSAEIGAWAGCLVLGWLMSHWTVFIYETRHLNLEVVHEIAAGDPTWILIDAAPPARGLSPTRTIID